MDSSGNLYGTTEKEATGLQLDGTVFELAQGSGTITTLASFNGTNGSTPRAGLIMDSSGNLYGTTAMMEAPTGDGTVFELAKGSGTITTLASFNGTNGARPVCRPDHGQQRQSVRHNGVWRRLRRRHGFRAGQWQRHDHHAGFVQRQQRMQTRLRPDHGQQRQPVRHDV